jgi:N-methylhydantoinase A
VTDAHVVLGHFGDSGLLGGEFELDKARAREALAQLASEMSKAAGRKISITEAAQGVLSVVNTNMERALRRISVERGYDPRDFVLLPFGGAGGLHAVDLARALRIHRMIAPASAGALSAIGVVAADVVKDQSRTVMIEFQAGVVAKLERTFSEMERSARAALRREGFTESKHRHERSLAARYKGQSFELEIKRTTGDIAGGFHRAHLARYGYAQKENVVEIVSARLRSIGVVEKLRQTRLAARRVEIAKPRDQVQTFLDGRQVLAGLYRREDLPAGSRLSVPCIVTEYSSTTLIPSGGQAQVDAFGNLIVNLPRL